MSFNILPARAGIYILELKDDCYYVGWSANLRQRIEAHFTDDGAAWTKIHAPVTILGLQVGASKAEEQVRTVQLMEKVGWEKVRGGNYCQVDLQCPHEFQQKMTCYYCGSAEHLVVDCDVRMADDQKPLRTVKTGRAAGTRREPTDPICARCWRKNHTAEKCYAKTRADGSSIVCDICGLTDHATDKCLIKQGAESIKDACQTQ